jgi:hypothetical protein
MFPNYGIMSEFLNEFYVMDVVVLNGALSPTAAVDEEKQNVGEREADPDGVVTDYCVGLFSVFSGEDAIGWPHVYLALKYNRRLALAKSAKKYGRRYANGCHHYRLPDTCWMIDPVVSHCVNIIVDLATVCQCENRQPGVMIRNVLLMDTVDDDANQCKKVSCKNATHFHQVALLLRPSPNGRHQCRKLFDHRMEEIRHRYCC